MGAMRRRIPKLTSEQEAAFWALTEKDEATGCLVWKGDAAGYSIEGMNYQAGRVAYRIHAKQQPPGKLGRVCSTVRCIWPEHTRAWPPKQVEKRSPDPHMREVGQAVSLILREQRVLAERVVGIARSIMGIEETLRAMVDVGERASNSFRSLDDAVREALQALAAAAPHGPTNGSGKTAAVDELGLSLMRAYEQSVGAVAHPAEADFDALRTAFDAAIGLARKTNGEATRVFSGWLGRFARLCVGNPGIEQSPRNFLRTLEAIAPEALEQHQ